MVKLEPKSSFWMNSAKGSDLSTIKLALYQWLTAKKGRYNYLLSN